MEKQVDIIGAGLAGSEAALQLARRGYRVRLLEMRPGVSTPVHHTGNCAELVCSNSFKSLKEQSAAGMLKRELTALESHLLAIAFETRVAAGGALAVDRELFSEQVTAAVAAQNNIERIEAEVVSLTAEGSLVVRESAEVQPHELPGRSDAIILATGPLTSDKLADFLGCITGQDNLSFYDAAAPIVLADSLDYERLFVQSRYEEAGDGDYLNAPFDQPQYEAFIQELIHAECVIKKDFETKELFQACQPIEEIARKGVDAPRFGPLKPVGLTNPATGRRPWAAVQLRAENADKQSYNLVGFQTNLTFPEQKRVFRMIPGLEQAEFARFGVMHRNTFINAPHLLDRSLCLRVAQTVCPTPVFVAGQLGGTEGYVEAIASGLVAALNVAALLRGVQLDSLPIETAFGALLAYATSDQTCDYQPMHVNFGIMRPLEQPIKNKQQRYAAYAKRGDVALQAYVSHLCSCGLLGADQ